MAKPGEFSAPPRGPGAPNPNIAKTVPLSQAPVQKQEAYAALAEARAAEDEGKFDKLDLDQEVNQDAYPAETGQPEKYLPNETDRKAFLSALMGGKPYSKKFTLYGGIQATFRDRTVDETELMYDILNKQRRALAWSDQDYELHYERYLLAIQLVRIDNTPYELVLFAENMEEDHTEKLSARVAQLMKLMRPVYHGLMEACRRFEGENNYMTEHALDADFWAPGGPPLRSARTVPAP